MNAGAVTWNDGKPEFDPVTQRDNYALKFVEVMRSASSSRPVEISYQDARGSAVTVRMPPGPSSQAHPISGDHDEEPGPGLLHFQPNTTES